MFMTYALPLSLGVEGRMESMDVKLLEDLPAEEVMERLNRSLPEGISVVEVTEPVSKPAEIFQAEYEIRFDVDHVAADVLRARMEAFFALERILVTKHTKKGDREIDVKPAVLAYWMEERENGLSLWMRLPAGESENINPSLLLDKMMEQWEEKPYFATIRHKIMDKDGNLFR